MPKFEVDFSYNEPMWGDVILEANDVEQAEQFAVEYVKDLGENIMDIKIEAVRELK